MGGIELFEYLIKLIGDYLARHRVRVMLEEWSVCTYGSAIR